MSVSYLSSPDQPSNIYPDRLIRPLPRRTIKSRLSQEAAESITYPPKPPSTDISSYAHYNENGEFMTEGKHLPQHNGVYDHEIEHEHLHDHDHDHDHEHDDDDEHCQHHHHCHYDHDEDDFDSADDSSPIALRHSSSYRSSPHSPRSRQARYGSYGSKASNALDGYEAFENTNNKKKRKIPTSGSLGLHHSSLTADLDAAGIAIPKEGEDAQYYNSHSPSGLGMQGAGRGRNGRKSGPRNPLGVSINGSNVRTTPSKYDQNLATTARAGDTKPDQGIISAAIANATALLRNPLGKGQENMGVLDQQTKSAPANSQFTFTCESEAKGVKFPEQSLYSPDYSQRVSHGAAVPSVVSNQKVSTQGTQTSPSTPSHNNQMPAPQHPPNHNSQSRKPRRRKGDVYALAARQRKLQQEYMNLQHPPPAEDIWICEFCEYESIFGEPPRALIRQYEIKDRRERKRLAEKQRLLEKAKLKGRKGKKQTKNSAKAATQAAQQANSHQQYDQQQTDQMGDDYLEDGYDDDPAPVPAPPPSQHVANKPQVMPGAYDNQPSGKPGGVLDKGGSR